MSDQGPQLIGGAGGSGALFTAVGRGETTFPSLARFEPIRIIGRGAFSTVWLAREGKPLDRLVAVKVLEPGQPGLVILRRFEREWALLVQAAGSGVTSLIDAGVASDGQAYIVMEYINGESITAYCDRRSLPLSQRLALVAQFAAIVDRLHAKGIVHRDLKPSNVFVRTDTKEPPIVVLDFGLAALLGRGDDDCSAEGNTDGEPLSTIGMPLGTPEWMAPEQTGLRSERIGSSADIWSIGLIIERLWLGRSRWGVGLRDEQTLQRVLTEVAAGSNGPTVPPQDSPHWDDLTPDGRATLGQIVRRATETDPAARSIEASEIVRTLTQLVTQDAARRAPRSTALGSRAWLARIALGICGIAALVWLIVDVSGGSGGIWGRFIAPIVFPPAPPWAGSVVAWGDNSDGRCELPREERFISIACGYRWTLGVTADGRVLAAGSINEPACQIPDALVRGREPVVKVATRDDGAVALTRDGRVVQWGVVANEATVSALTGVRDIACGRKSLVIVNSSGGIVVAAAEPGGMERPVPTDKAVHVAVGHKSACVTTDDGRAYAWGSNASKAVEAVQGTPAVAVAIAGRDSQTTAMLVVAGDGTLRNFGWSVGDTSGLAGGVAVVAGARAATWFVAGLKAGGVVILGHSPSVVQAIPDSLIPATPSSHRIAVAAAGESHVAVILGE